MLPADTAIEFDLLHDLDRCEGIGGDVEQVAVIAPAEVAVAPTEPVAVAPEGVAPAPELDAASATPAVVTPTPTRTPTLTLTLTLAQPGRSSTRCERPPPQATTSSGGAGDCEQNPQIWTSCADVTVI